MNKLFLSLTVLLATQAFAQTEIKNTFFGDIRFREEGLDNENVANARENYDQLKTRVRIGARTQISDTLSTEIRLATGTGGISTNQTVGTNSTQNYDFRLDRAFAKITPNESLLIRAGRTENPFVIVGENSMMFDADLNFDGASVAYTHKMDATSLQLIVAHSILKESTNAKTNADATLTSAELVARFGNDTHGFMVTVAEHVYSRIKGNVAVVGFNGNTSTGSGAGVYAYDYDVSDFGLEYAYKGMSVPVTLFAEMAKNNRTSNEETGLIYGVRVNKMKKKNDWMLSVDNREVQANSTLASLADSDAFNGGTNGRSLVTSAGYAFDDNANVVASYCSGQYGIASGETEVDRKRVQLDLNIKF